MKFKHGLAFPDADQYLYDRLPETGVWQQDALEAGLNHCKNFRTAIDGGAHIGTWTIELSKKFDSVVSFEPSGDTFQAFCKNIFNKRCNNIDPRQEALGKDFGLCSILMDKKDKDREHTGARYIGRGIEIPIIPIDSIRLYDVDFIKLDLEGGELDALKGARETLLRCKPIMVIEDGKFNERFGYKKTDTSDYLIGLGANLLEKCGINYVWGWE